MIKLKNNRTAGSLFHYAHFLCDCLFPEIINEVFLYKEVIREKNIHQTIGNFNKIYTEVMNIKNTELVKDEFNNLKIEELSYKNKESYCNKIYFNIFRTFIFSRYNINPLEYKLNYPEVILIKRGNRINLIDDSYLNKINLNIKTGKEKREINDINEVENYLKNKYSNKFKSLYFENISFEEQVLYFNNAKIIICAHGAVMSNMFFCKEGTTIVEVTCNCTYLFFNTISNILKLKHIKCVNNYNDIIKKINSIK
jgi:hypothetical protein